MLMSHLVSWYYLNETDKLTGAHLAIHRYKLGLSYVSGIIPGTREKLVKVDMDPFMQILRGQRNRGLVLVLRLNYLWFCCTTVTIHGSGVSFWYTLM